MTDAAHMLTDFIGFVIGLFAIWLSHKSPTKYMNYGWHRAGKIETTAKNDAIMMLCLLPCLLFLSLTLNCIRGVPWYPTFFFSGSAILTPQNFWPIIFVIA